MNKVTELQRLWIDLATDLRCEHLQAKRNGITSDVSLINQFARHSAIPNKWFDWTSRANSRIMVIGQDWGPYIFLQKYSDDWEKENDKSQQNLEKFMFKTFSSRTEKFIMKTIPEVYNKATGKDFDESLWSEFIFTVAVMFTRSGTKFRGNENFDERQSVALSQPYLSRQIEIVKPSIILTLGNTALNMVADHFLLNLGDITLTNLLSKPGQNQTIHVDSTEIIPAFHPAAHVHPDIQKKQWETMWKVYSML